ncbi:MAG: hypothetical protein HYZ34_09450 [Ignavibacteriae bacterium]|nr:hypothetical protein [Ignavibacteriota bacterium]
MKKQYKMLPLGNLVSIAKGSKHDKVIGFPEDGTNMYITNGFENYIAKSFSSWGRLFHALKVVAILIDNRSRM